MQLLDTLEYKSMDIINSKCKA